MSINKNYLKATVGLALAVSSVPIFAPIYTEAATFSDVPQSAYYSDAVHVLAERGIINGYEDASFKPDVVATRGQTAKILAGILGLDTINVVDPGFTDVLPDNPFYGAIAALVQAGIINGYEDHTFRMNEPLQRNHLAKILVKAFDLKSPEGATMPLTDAHKAYKDYILALYTNGITTGKTDTLFDGESYVTRGQLAAFVVRTEEVVQAANDKEQPDIDTSPPVEPIPTPNPSLTFTLSIEGMSELFSTVTEYELMTTAVIGTMYMEGDVVKITFVSEEAIPKESFKIKINGVEYEFKFNKNENIWGAKKVKEAISTVPDYTPTPVPEPTPTPTPKPPSTISVTGISLNSTTATINQGETAQLTATILPANATNKNVKWTSSDETIATVDATGKVTAIGQGTTTITATTVDGLKKVTATIEVVVPVTGITLNQTTGSLNLGETTTLVETITPTDATNQAVLWSSSNPTVATVDANGEVTAIGVGTATITVTTADSQHTATYVANVNPTVAISGTTKVGEILAADTITPAAATVSYQWEEAVTKNGPYTNIPNATNATIQLSPDQAGKYIRVVVTVTDSYTSSVTSTATTMVTSSVPIIIHTSTFVKPLPPPGYNDIDFPFAKHGFVFGDYIYWPFEDSGNIWKLIVVAFDGQGNAVKTFNLTGFRYVENITIDEVNKKIKFTVQDTTVTRDWSFFEVNN